MLDLKNEIAKGARRLDKTEWGFDRSKYLNASEAGRCIRAAWFSKRTADNYESNGYARRGHYVERYVADVLSHSNEWRLITHESPDGNILSNRDEELHLSSTLDMVLHGGPPLNGTRPHLHPIEVKSFDPRSNTSRFPKQAHLDQLHLGMALLYGRGGFTVDTGHLLYVNASDFDDIHAFKIDLDLKILDRMASRAKRVLGMKKVDALDREGVKTKECRTCPFKEQCGVDVPDDATTKRANRGSGLHDALVDYNAAKTAAEQADTAKTDASERIKAELRKRGTSEVTIDGYLIKIEEMKGRSTLDRKALTAAGIDPTKFEKTGKPFERLTVAPQ